MTLEPTSGPAWAVFASQHARSSKHTIAGHYSARRGLLCTGTRASRSLAHSARAVVTLGWGRLSSCDALGIVRLPLLHADGAVVILVHLVEQLEDLAVTITMSMID
eukprot:8907283-Pyramimonas_sp.AAC.2